MTDPDFPEELRSFIQDTIPTVDAAELLLVLAGRPDEEHSLADLISAMRPATLTEPVARRYLSQFQSAGMVVATGDTYRYKPQSPELDGLVRALTKVFNERPVTLVRIIYAPRDEKIRSFADAFRLKKP